MVRSLVRHRWLLYELIVRDLALRYRGSALGFFWTFLNPLLTMLIYTLVFTVYLRVAIPHYAVFLIAGLLPWLWFGGAITMGTSSIVDGRMYVSRTVFAPIVLIAVPIFSNAVNYLLSIPLLIIIAWLSHVSLGWPILTLPVLMMIQFLLTLGILLSLATYNVFYRDLQQLMVTILSLLFYLAPIFYPIANVPDRFRPFLFLDPMVALVLGYQNIFYYDRLPSAALLTYAFVVSLALCAAGRAVFERHKDAFADFA